jgi:hypothetical protein
MAQNAIKPEEIDAGAAQQELELGQNVERSRRGCGEVCAGERSDPRSAGEAGQRPWRYFVEE